MADFPAFFPCNFCQYNSSLPLTPHIELKKQNHRIWGRSKYWKSFVDPILTDWDYVFKCRNLYLVGFFHAWCLDNKPNQRCPQGELEKANMVVETMRLKLRPFSMCTSWATHVTERRGFDQVVLLGWIFIEPTSFPCHSTHHNREADGGKACMDGDLAVLTILVPILAQRNSEEYMSSA